MSRAIAAIANCELQMIFRFIVFRRDDAGPPKLRTIYESASRNLLSRFRDARILADTPSLSLMSGEAPCLTNHFSRDGSNSFCTPWCRAVWPYASWKLTSAPLRARNLAALNFLHSQHAREGVSPPTTSIGAPERINTSSISTSSHQPAA